MAHEFDVVVIGSGFGGSVAALRLREKGYTVAVLEAGRRFEDKDFPKTSWRLRKFLFAPALGLYGIQRIHALPDVLILCGAGVGGGSLVYANTLYQPGDKYFDDPQWKSITDWKSELTPFYELARRMLGVEINPYFSPSDQAMKDVAEQLGVGHTFTLAPLGIHFGKGEGIESPDPYFGGVGPARTGCTNCGSCMTGCRHNAKNTLPKNYLGLAEKAGAEVFPLTTATKLEQRGDGSWKITTKKTDDVFGSRGKTFIARDVVMAAGTYNTQKLMHTFKATTLPKISDFLGNLSRTNSEALTGAIMPTTKIDFSRGAAITSSFYPSPDTHVEPVRYGKGSNSMGLLQTLLTDGWTSKERRRHWVKQFVARPSLFAKILNVHKWSERTVITLVMQNVDSSIKVFMKRGIFGNKLTSTNDSEHPNATYIPAANETIKKVAENYGGIAAGTVGDLIGAPFTAHFVGGCVIGTDENSGVIDPYHRVYNYPTLHVVDGSTITANLGVNPSLTITAQAERAFAMWPNKGESDPRPAQGATYSRISPIAPIAAVVPRGAIGELRIVEVK
ncbi:MAG: FAD-dependent oxidoreductase [Actinobacteria bacterium]|uniref:Cholesterol oxidase n=1 Tax=freshwater metagenome TaxID=449393 RepID=A0A6J7P595_9ZZZZ|nr:FAD-dependent oxidoreductase [Actinomycetota bacterium]